jgi:hypothetical protein
LKNIIEYYETLFYTKEKRFDLEYVCNAHSKAQEEMEAKNHEANKNRIKVSDEFEMRAISNLYPPLVTLNRFKNRK